ncbi:glucoamylase family protein [uncultured Sphingomonas sp.]|uniref:glucoamylase family protein n=1 Tax=uncultured Sphingomonas sp. TaxID=158754 RepID=UPI0025EACD57|nr:glucoamylase family protein [uncultured Sphingomonas sp.]
MLDRRLFLANASLGLAGMVAGCKDPAVPLSIGAAAPALPLPDFYAEIEYRTFRYFRDTVNPLNGLVPERWPSPSAGSIAAVGCALTIWPIAVARGWIKRDLARDLTLATLRFFDSAPQGDDAEGMSGNRGFFYRMLDMKTGTRRGKAEISSVDHALLNMGMLFAAGWWTGDTPEEQEIRRLGVDIADRAEWLWMQNGGTAIARAWRPESGFGKEGVEGYGNGMAAVLLSLGSGRHPAEDGAWEAWCAPYVRYWRGEGETRHLAYGPLTGHQHSHMWIDFRGIRDTVMRGAGFDYHENSRRATYANRAYCISNPMKWDGYSADLWGIAESEGPGAFSLPFKGEKRTFYGYGPRGPLDQPGERDDGTIAATAALGSLPFASEIVIPAARALTAVPGLYREYGLLGGYNRSFRYTDQKVTTGNVSAENGWMARDYLALGQAPVIIQAGNYRDEFVWKVMRKSPVLRRGLQRAGFTGGWLK